MLYGIAKSYKVESVASGYHIFEKIWSAAVGATPFCQQESVTTHESYAAAMIKDDVVNGHVLRNISAFLIKGGVITVLTEVRQYSSDLPQGDKVLCYFKEISINMLYL